MRSLEINEERNLGSEVERLYLAALHSHQRQENDDEVGNVHEEDRDGGMKLRWGYWDG